VAPFFGPLCTFRLGYAVTRNVITLKVSDLRWDNNLLAYIKSENYKYRMTFLPTVLDVTTQYRLSRSLSSPVQLVQYTGTYEIACRSHGCCLFTERVSIITPQVQVPSTASRLQAYGRVS